MVEGRGPRKISMYLYQSISRENSQVVALENEVFQRAGTTNSQNTQIHNFPAFHNPDIKEIWKSNVIIPSAKKLTCWAMCVSVYHEMFKIQDLRIKQLVLSGLRDLQRIFLPHW